MSISADIIRGNTDTIILAQLLLKNSYGYEIKKKILSMSNNEYELKEATLYSAFRRLEKSGYVVSYWGEQDAGARRRYYKITADGKLAYQKSKDEWNAAKNIIDQLIG